MLDYGAAKAFPSNLGTRPRGVGQHPHQGFETVTIAFQGEVEHHDNQGHTGVIGPGNVQWMTAGSGVVHEEYHSKIFSKGNTEDNVLEMCFRTFLHNLFSSLDQLSLFSFHPMIWNTQESTQTV